MYLHVYCTCDAWPNLPRSKSSYHFYKHPFLKSQKHALSIHFEPLIKYTLRYKTKWLNLLNISPYLAIMVIVIVH